MSKHYKGQERITLRKEVESQRDSGHSFITIASTLGISPTFAAKLYKEAKQPIKLSPLDRLKLWLTFKL